MKTNEIKNLDHLKKLTSLYFRTLKPLDDNTENNVAQIKFANYFELGCAITNLLKMCILTLDHDAHKISNTNKNPINVSLILEMVLEIFPLDEFEFLSEVSEMFIEKNHNLIT
ncbi:hypothetical protein [Flavobacterium defluvii]|uniref:Uncharacterized protein n=1 Tax=Flavobacterium defluvii TaxID=370979 RepID=A0A1M5EWF1_9FLAO|nr:hypothetical protein [Flavobacterium defluvii]SHF83534.1 hypothetical protein SAMN05443663_101271 [Flavobacterium defluvii]